MMKQSDDKFEQLLQDNLVAPKAPEHLRQRLEMIPEQFSQPANVKSRNYSHRSRAWLWPALATAASVMGFMIGFQDFMGVIPTDNTLLTSLFYGNPGGFL